MSSFEDKITRGMRRVLSRGGVKMTCPDCELPIPVYPGRYPARCPNCGGLLGNTKSVEEMVLLVLEGLEPEEVLEQISQDALVQKQVDSLHKLLFFFDDYELKIVPVDQVKVVEDGEKNPIYADDLKSGEEFPPIAVIRDGAHYNIIDGNRRYRSAVAVGLRKVWVMILKGFKVGYGKDTA